jgi:hypothetical protein
VLTIIPEPIPEVDSLHGHLIKLISAGDPGHEEGEEGIFNIAMTPWASKRTFCTRGREYLGRMLTVDAFHSRRCGNVTRPKGTDRVREEQEDSYGKQGWGWGERWHGQRESGGARAALACAEGRLVRERSVIVAKSAPSKVMHRRLAGQGPAARPCTRMRAGWWAWQDPDVMYYCYLELRGGGGNRGRSRGRGRGEKMQQRVGCGEAVGSYGKLWEAVGGGGRWWQWSVVLR